NKVATAVELRFDILNSPSLPEPVRERLLARRDRRVTGDGVLVLSAQRFRTQDRNRQDARERLAHFIEAGLHAPKKRVATKPTRGSKERRLAGKRERSTIKQGRTKRDWDLSATWIRPPTTSCRRCRRACRRCRRTAS